MCSSDLEIFQLIHPNDWVFSNWRSHYHALLKGIPEEALFDMISEQNARTRMLIVNKAGHFHYREYPDEWVRNVLNFLSYWQ